MTPRVGISRCLLGDEVRYDGGHKRSPLVMALFGPDVEWVPICPEVEAGMGTPREAIHLVAEPGGVASGSEHVRLVGVRSGVDWTRDMHSWTAERVRSLPALELSGYVLKKDSPSCGMERVRVHHGRGATATRTGRGLFAQQLLERFPNLPVEEEGRLEDQRLRENFVERVAAYQRVRQLLRSRWTIGALVTFHTAHKLQLLAHSRGRYAELGAMVAAAKRTPRGELAARYEETFMRALRTPATPGRHADVLRHMAGHLKKLIDAGDRAELETAIEQQRLCRAPLAVPLTLIRHHVRRHSVAYLAGQSYLALPVGVGGAGVSASRG